MDDKKRLILLMAILGISLVGGGIWFFMNMAGDEVGVGDVIVPSFSKIENIQKASKRNAIYVNSSSSLLNSFYKNKRYQELEDNSVEVIIFGMGNPEPFAPLVFSSSTE